MARMIVLMSAAAVALAGCNSGKQQAAGDQAVAVNSGDAAANASGRPR